MKQKALKEPSKILVIRLRAIGDALVCTPVIRSLKKAYPHSEIHFLTEEIPAQILKHNPYIHKLIVSPKRKSSLLEQIKFLNSIRNEKYDWVVDLFGNPRSAWITLASLASVKVGYAFRVRKWVYTHKVPLNQVRKYQADVNLDITRFIGVPDEGLNADLILTGDEVSWAKSLLGYFETGGVKIGLNPSGSWSAKKWPDHYWIQLAKKINETFKVKPIFLWGPADKEWIESIKPHLKDVCYFAPETSLRQLASLISQMDLLVGNDGAPHHMAQALNVKSLTFFGPTWGLSWSRPNDSRQQFLQQFYACGPCDKTKCPLPPFFDHEKPYEKMCLAEISVDKVLGSMKKLI